MLKRTLTGLGLAAMIIGVILASHYVSAIFVDMLVLIFTAGAVYELHHCFRSAGYKTFIAPSVIVLTAGYPAFYLANHFTSPTSNVGFLALLCVLLVAVMAALIEFTFRPAKCGESELTEGELKNASEIKDLFANVFILVYPVLFMALAWGLSYKYYAVFTIMLAVFMPCGCDAFAYWFGSMIKGKKLCPKISPKKTIAGAVGGLVGGMAFQTPR